MAMNKLIIESNEIKKSFERLNLLVISTVGRAGSMLLQSLFDNHPEVVVIPDVAQSYNYIDIFKRVNFDIAKWLDEHKNFYNGFDPYNQPFNTNVNNKFIENRKKFEDIFNNIIYNFDGIEKINSKSFMIALSLSLAVINDQDITKLKYILFHHHNNRRISIEMPLMLNDFSELKVLVAIRHPIENALSFQTLEIRTSISIFRKFSRNTRGWSVKSWRQLQTLKQQLLNKNSFKLLDLNTLHNNPDELLKKVTQWLNLENNDILKQPSILGIPWLGNSADGKPIQAFEKKRSILLYPITLDTKKGLTSEEYLFAEYFCRDIMIKLGYENSVSLKSMNIFRFLFILFKNIEFYNTNITPHDKGIRSIIRKFGYSEIALVLKEIIVMKIKPIESLKEYRIDEIKLRDSNDR